MGKKLFTWINLEKLDRLKKEMNKNEDRTILVPVIQNILFKLMNWHKVIIHSFPFLSFLLSSGVWQRKRRPIPFFMFAENKTACIQDVRLTGYADAIAVRVRDDQPSLQFIHANATWPFKTKVKPLISVCWFYFSTSLCVNVFLKASLTQNHASVLHIRRRRAGESQTELWFHSDFNMMFNPPSVCITLFSALALENPYHCIQM